MFQTYILIMIGCALGGAGRYWCSGFVAEHFGETFPWGTIIVNVVGSFAIGFVATLTGPDGRAPPLSLRNPEPSTALLVWREGGFFGISRR